MVKRKKSRAASVTAIVITVIAASGIAFILNLLWNFLYSYELNNPANVAKEFALLLENRQYEDFAEKIGFEFDEFNNRNEFSKYLENLIDENEPIEVKNIKNNETEKIFSLICNEKTVTELTLTPKGQKDSYGLEEWLVEAKKPEKPYKIMLVMPSNSVADINGISISDKYLKDDIIPSDEYNNIGSELLIANYKSYYIDNLLNPPHASVKYNGIDTELYPLKNADEYISYIAPSEQDINDGKNITETVAKKYSEFSTTNIQFADLAPYLVEGSDLFNRLKVFKNEWYKQHTLTYDNINVSNVIFYDETHFSSDISYTLNVNFTNRTTQYEIKYNMYFIKLNDKWKLASLLL